MTTITHPTMGTKAPIAWTVGTDAGEVAAVKDRFGWCFYLLPQEELIGLIFSGTTCLDKDRQLCAMPWKRSLEKSIHLTVSNLKSLALEIGNKHAELKASGEWSRFQSESLERRQRIDREMEGSDGKA